MNDGRRHSLLEAEALALAAGGAVERAPATRVPREREARSPRLDAQVGRQLLERRIIPLFGFIDDDVAGSVVSKLMTIGHRDAPITLVIDSPGGVVTSGFAIVDAIEGVRAPVATQCIGRAHSMAAVVAAAGEPGCRSVFPRARFMVHQPFDGGATQRALLDVEWARTEIASFLASRCGKPVDEVRADLDSERSFSANEALAYGLVDSIEVAGRAWMPPPSEEPS